jgi:hypothetical protein
MFDMIVFASIILIFYGSLVLSYSILQQIFPNPRIFIMENIEDTLIMTMITPYQKVEKVEDFVTRQTEVNRLRWNSVNAQFPNFSRKHGIFEKRSNQKKINEQMDWITEMLENNSNFTEASNRFREESATRLKSLGSEVLELTDNQLAVFENEQLVDISRKFFEDARKFDPTMPFEDIFQASRNVWTATYLQILLGLEAKLTPAIFAYSMLYPITDNYLDDPQNSCEDIHLFNQHFGTWLGGGIAEPENDQEMIVIKLIRMIEDQFPRAIYPQVYEALLSIFRAQADSTKLQKKGSILDLDELIRITMRKGGTSVLADGFLAAGTLTEAQMRTIFDYGCFAQLMDDQEDVDDDLHSGSQTLFTRAAKVGKLDELMNRVFAYSNVILKELDDFMTERSTPLIQVSLKGIDLLLINACAGTASHYSRGYLCSLEDYFPVSYGFLNRINRKIKKRGITLEKLLFRFWPEYERQTMKTG